MVRPPAAPALPANRVEALDYLGIERAKRAEKLRANGWTIAGVARVLGVPKAVIEKLVEGK